MFQHLQGFIVLLHILALYSLAQHTQQSGCQFQDGKATYNIQLEGMLSHSAEMMNVKKEMADLTRRILQLEQKQVNDTPMKAFNATCFSDNITVYRSCASGRNFGLNTSGFYWIQPTNNVHPFLVHCNMLDIYGGKEATVIYHDSMLKTAVPKCQPARCHQHEVNYIASTEQIKSLTEISQFCKQFVRYDCHNSVFNHESSPVSFATWYSFDGAGQDYWGGAEPGSGKCACGMTYTCDDPGKSCNCDSNDNTWRVDSGYLRHKETLPVSKLTFGDTDASNENGFFTLGPLICY